MKDNQSSKDPMIVNKVHEAPIPVGRTKSNLDLPFGWQDIVLNTYRQGGSDVEIKALIYEWRNTFSNDLWYRWLKEEPEFSETIKMGKVLSEAWWTKEGRSNLENREFSFTGWYMNMKNRFGWKDRTDVTSGDERIKQAPIVVSPIKSRDVTAKAKTTASS